MPGRPGWRRPGPPAGPVAASAWWRRAGPGGDCTRYGCVPSKTLLDVARRLAGARAGQQWGLPPVGEVDFGRVMRHDREVIARIGQDESPERLAAEGIDLTYAWPEIAG